MNQIDIQKKLSILVNNLKKMLTMKNFSLLVVTGALPFLIFLALGVTPQLAAVAGLVLIALAFVQDISTAIVATTNNVSFLPDKNVDEIIWDNDWNTKHIQAAEMDIVSLNSEINELRKKVLSNESTYNSLSSLVKSESEELLSILDELKETLLKIELADSERFAKIAHLVDGQQEAIDILTNKVLNLNSAVNMIDL